MRNRWVRATTVLAEAEGEDGKARKTVRVTVPGATIRDTDDLGNYVNALSERIQAILDDDDIAVI